MAADPPAEPAANTTTDGSKTTIAIAVAAMALLVYVVLVVVLWGKADDANNETAWARWTFLVGGIEALAFASAGWLFGREINRGAAETAQQKTTEAADAKAKTDAIVAYLETEAGAPPAAASDRLGVGTAAKPDLQKAAAFARQLRDG